MNPINFTHYFTWINKLKKPAGTPGNKVAAKGILPASSSTPNWFQYADYIDTYLARPIFHGTTMTGKVVAEAAQKIYEETGKFLPPAFVLAQGQMETALGVKTKTSKHNYFNVYEYDRPTETSKKLAASLDSPEKGVSSYMSLLAQDYLVGTKTVNDLLTTGFVNKNNHRYASATGYEEKILEQMSFIQDFVTKQWSKDLDLVQRGGNSVPAK